MPFPHEKEIEVIETVETFDISEVANEVSIDILKQRLLRPGEYVTLAEEELTHIPGAILTNSASTQIQQGFSYNPSRITGEQAPAIYGVLPDACLFGPYQLIATRDGRFLRENWVMQKRQCWYNYTYAKQNQQSKIAPQKTDFRVFQASLGHSENYGHLIRDSLSLGRMLDNLVSSEELISSVYGVPKFIYEFFGLFRPNDESLIHRGLAVETPELHFVSQPPFSLAGLDYVRRRSTRIVQNVQERPNALYVSRKGYRRSIENEEQIIPVLQKYNIAYIEPQKLSVKHQIELFSGANLVLGALGAALCNSAFMPEQSIVIELCDPTRFEETFFMFHAACTRCHYAKIVGEMLPEYANMEHVDFHGNFVLQPEVLDEALGLLFSS